MTSNSNGESPDQVDDQEIAEEQQLHFQIQRIYLKDLAFETPIGPKAFVSKEQLKINQELGTEVKKIDDDVFETVLRLTISAKFEDETAFLVEVHQAGLFHIKGFKKQLLTRVLNTICPQTLFPYVRETIDSILIRGSFPAVMLPPVNFDVLFAQALAEKEASTKNGQTH